MTCDAVGATAPPLYTSGSHIYGVPVDFGGIDDGTELSRNFECVNVEYLRVGVDSDGVTDPGITGATIIYAEFSGASGTWPNAKAQITITMVPPFTI